MLIPNKVYTDFTNALIYFYFNLPRRLMSLLELTIPLPC